MHLSFDAKIGAEKKSESLWANKQINKNNGEKKPEISFA